MFDSVPTPNKARALSWRPLCGLILGKKINIRWLFLSKLAWLSLPVNCFLDKYVWGQCNCLYWSGLCQLLLAEQDFVLLKILVLFFLASMPLRHVHGRGVGFNCNDQPFEAWECRDIKSEKAGGSAIPLTQFLQWLEPPVHNEDPGELDGDFCNEFSNQSLGWGSRATSRQQYLKERGEDWMWRQNSLNTMEDWWHKSQGVFRHWVPNFECLRSVLPIYLTFRMSPQEHEELN